MRSSIMDTSKVILFIRHPQYTWDFEQMLNAQGNDPERALPPDHLGREQSKLLLDFLEQQLLSADVSATRALQVYSSTHERSAYLSRLIVQRFRSRVLVKGPELLEVFSEVHTWQSREQILQALERAKVKRRSLFYEWLDEHTPSEIATVFSDKISDIKRGLALLRTSPTNLNLVIGHRLTFALTFWVIAREEKGTGVDNVLPKEVFEILEISERIPYTSISEVILSGNCFKVQGVGQTPHLDKKPHLKRVYTELWSPCKEV